MVTFNGDITFAEEVRQYGASPKAATFTVRHDTPMYLDGSIPTLRVFLMDCEAAGLVPHIRLAYWNQNIDADPEHEENGKSWRDFKERAKRVGTHVANSRVPYALLTLEPGWNRFVYQSKEAIQQQFKEASAAARADCHKLRVGSAAAVSPGSVPSDMKALAATAQWSDYFGFEVHWNADSIGQRIKGLANMLADVAATFSRIHGSCDVKVTRLSISSASHGADGAQLVAQTEFLESIDAADWESAGISDVFFRTMNDRENTERAWDENGPYDGFIDEAGEYKPAFGALLALMGVDVEFATELPSTPDEIAELTADADALAEELEAVSTRLDESLRREDKTADELSDIKRELDHPLVRAALFIARIGGGGRE